MNFILGENRNFSGQNSPLLQAEKHFATGLNPKKFCPVSFSVFTACLMFILGTCHLLQNDYFCRQHSCFLPLSRARKNRGAEDFIDDKYTHKIE